MADKSKAKPEAIQKVLGDYVSGLPVTTRAFLNLVSSPPGEREGVAAQIHALEAAADERYIKLMRKIAGSFITPFDREYLHDLIGAVDGVISSLDRATYLVIDFEVFMFPTDFLSAADELVGMSEQTQEAVALLRKPNRLLETLALIDQHKDALDHHYRALLKSILIPGADPISAQKIKILADAIADVAADLNHFARRISVTAIKE